MPFGPGTYPPGDPRNNMPGPFGGGSGPFVPPSIPTFPRGTPPGGVGQVPNRPQGPDQRQQDPRGTVGGMQNAMQPRRRVRNMQNAMGGLNFVDQLPQFMQQKQPFMDRIGMGQSVGMNPMNVLSGGLNRPMGGRDPFSY